MQFHKLHQVSNNESTTFTGTTKENCFSLAGGYIQCLGSDDGFVWGFTGTTFNQCYWLELAFCSLFNPAHIKPSYCTIHQHDFGAFQFTGLMASIHHYSDTKKIWDTCHYGCDILAHLCSKIQQKPIYIYTRLIYFSEEVLYIPFYRSNLKLGTIHKHIYIYT